MWEVAVRGAEAPDAGERDLLMLAVTGVQTFISESRSTSDLRFASEIIAALAAEAAATLRDGDAELIHPSQVANGTTGIPNRIVARTPPGRGEELARRAADAVHTCWRGWVCEVFGFSVETPGMPSLRWVCVPASAGDYAAQWEQAHTAWAARRLIRDFPPLHQQVADLCSLSPHLPAAAPRNPPQLPRYERDTLSAANWVKRRWGRISGSERIGYPSTPSIASAPYRARLLEEFGDPKVRAAVETLRAAVETLQRCVQRCVQQLDPGREQPVPGLPAKLPDDLARWFRANAGPWVYDDVWQREPLIREYGVEDLNAETVRNGLRACRDLSKAAEYHGIAPPATYLALIAQDIDNLGRFLSGGGKAVNGSRCPLTPAGHRGVSQRILDVAAEQQRQLENAKRFGVTVYAGGDDLLALTPAKTALDAAQGCHDLIPTNLPTASTAVLFFHRREPLRRAVAETRQLLGEAKASVFDKHAFAIGYLRRSGARATSIQPWQVRHADGEATAPKLFRIFIDSDLSPRLVADLERDAAELANPMLRDPWYEEELTRLVTRHGGTPANAESLLLLGARERAHANTRAAGAHRAVPVDAAKIAVFLRQECR